LLTFLSFQKWRIPARKSGQNICIASKGVYADLGLIEQMDEKRKIEDQELWIAVDVSAKLAAKMLRV